MLGEKARALDLKLVGKCKWKEGLCRFLVSLFQGCSTYA